jgi:hypothetical protein
MYQPPAWFDIRQSDEYLDAIGTINVEESTMGMSD